MQVRVEPHDGPPLVKGDRPAVAVVIDALRASATIAVALSLGVEKIIPVAELDQARPFQGRPGHLTIGERGGKWVEGFDFGNSPHQLMDNAARIKGQTLVLTTSNGTRAILRAAAAEAVIIGSMPNLTAVTRRCFELAQEMGGDVALLPAGWLGRVAVEDLYVAGRIGQGLARLGATFEPDPEMAALLARDAREVFFSTGSGQLLISLGYEPDVGYCATADSLAVVPRSDGQALVAG